MKVIRKEEKGSASIESAIIMPVIFLVVLALIYCSMFLHDVTVIKAYVLNVTEEEAQKLSDQEMMQYLEKRLLIVTNITASSNQNKKTEIQIEGEISTPFKELFGLVKKDKITITEKREKDIDSSDLYKKKLLKDIVTQ